MERQILYCPLERSEKDVFLILFNKLFFPFGTLTAYLLASSTTLSGKQNVAPVQPTELVTTDPFII